MLVLELYYIGRMLVFNASIIAVYLAVRSVVGALCLNTLMQIKMLTLHISVCSDHMLAFLLFPVTQHPCERLEKTNTITTKVVKPNMYLLVEESLCISVSFLIPSCLLLGDCG